MFFVQRPSLKIHLWYFAGFGTINLWLPRFQWAVPSTSLDEFPKNFLIVNCGNSTTKGINGQKNCLLSA